MATFSGITGIRRTRFQQGSREPAPGGGPAAARLRARWRSFQTSSISFAPARPYSRGRGGIREVSTSS